MFVLLIINGEHNRSYWENLMGKNNFNYLIIHYDQLNNLEKISYIEENQAIILDRVDIDLIKLKKFFTKADFYIISNNSLEEKKYHLNNDIKLKFYIYPILSRVIIDDIKSITKIKDYVKFGEINVGNILLDINTHCIYNKKKSVYLRKKEFELLNYLACNKGKVLSRSLILDQVWDMNCKVVTNTVDVHISRLRKILKLEFGINSLIRTIPCCGYMITEVYGE